MVISIHSDNPEATKIVRQLCTLCLQHGAEWHPELQINICNGEMSLSLPKHSLGELIRIPTHLFIPISEAQWIPSPDTLILGQADGRTSPLQRELIRLQINLYNATNKLACWSNRNPLSTLVSQPALCTQLLHLKPSYKSLISSANAAEGFLRTRGLHWVGPPPFENGTTVLLPIVDFLNHHQGGAGFTISDHGVSATVAQPTNTTECFAHYGGSRDTLELALNYGYFDMSTEIANSLYIELRGRDSAKVIVGDNCRLGATHSERAPLLKAAKNSIWISHFQWQHHRPQMEMIARLLFEASLKRAGRGREESHLYSKGLVRSIAIANIREYRSMLEILENSSSNRCEVLELAIKRQVEIISSCSHTY